MGCGESKQAAANVDHHQTDLVDNGSRQGHALVLCHASSQYRYDMSSQASLLGEALTSLGLHVQLHVDITAEQVTSLVKRFSIHSRGGGLKLIVTLGGTDSSGRLIAAGGATFTPSQLWIPFLHCEQPFIAPRLFLIHAACTGDPNIAMSALATQLPHRPDFFLAFSCMQGGAGNYVRALSDELTRRGHVDDVMTLVTRVQGQVKVRHHVATSYVSFLHRQIVIADGMSNFRESEINDIENNEVNLRVRDSELTTAAATNKLGSEYTMTSPARGLIFYTQDQRVWARKLRAALCTSSIQTRLVQIRGANIMPVLADEISEENLTGYSCMVVAVLGPLNIGPDGACSLVGPGGSRLPLSHVTKSLATCSSLKENPKVLLFLDPSGQAKADEVAVASVRQIPLREDLLNFLIVCGFSPGFTEALCRELEQSAENPSRDATRVVTRALARSGEPSSLAATRHLSHVTSGLTAILKLPRPGLQLLHMHQDSDGASSVGTSVRGSIEVLNNNSEHRLLVLPRPSVSNFQVRLSQVEAMTNQLSTGVRQHLIDIAIVGPPGVGKSELALYQAYKSLPQFFHIIWIPSGTRAAIECAFINLARKLNILQDDYINILSIVDRVYSNLSPNSTLFIFDNVIDYEILQTYLPYSRNVNRTNLCFIVTSEHKKWRCNLNLLIDTFSINECEDYLTENIGYIIEGKSLLLTKMLGSFPLSFQITISCIRDQYQSMQMKQQKYKLTDFFTKYSLVQKSITEMETSIENFSKDNFYNPLTVIWFIAIENISSKVSGKLAINILDMLSFMEQDSINLDIFSSLSQNVGHNNLKESIQILASHSLIHINENEISVHKLIQSLTRKHMIKKSLVLDNVLSMIIDNFKLSGSTPEEHLNNYVNHVLRIWKHSLKYVDIIKKYNSIAHVIMKCKNLSIESRLLFVENNIGILEKNLGWNFKTLLMIKFEYVELLWKSDNCDKVLLECDKILSRLPQDLNMHRDTLRMIYTKGRSLHRLGKLHEAWLLYVNLFMLRRREFGDLDPDTCRTLGGMCSTATELESSGDPVPLRLCLDLLEETSLDLKADFEPVLVRVANMAWRLSWDFRWEVGLGLFDRLHGTITSKLGVDHPRSLLVLLSKAEVLFYMDKHEDSWIVCETVSTLLGLELKGIVPSVRKEIKKTIQQLEEQVRAINLHEHATKF